MDRMKTSIYLSLSLGLLLGFAHEAPRAAAGSGPTFLAYVGTYTRGSSKGIYAYRFDARSGKLAPLGLAAETVHPSFLAVHPTGKFLYAVNEIDDFRGQKTGSVSAFAIDPRGGKLAPLNVVPARGTISCHLVVDRSGRTLLVANYGSGSVAAFRLGADGRLVEPASGFVQHQGSSVDRTRQQGPHAHSIDLSADQRFAVTADLGLDRVLVYRFDPARGALEPNDPLSVAVAPGSGPRHFAFHPAGRYAYAINELKSTVTAFAWDAARGALREIQTVSALPAGFRGTSHTAEIEVHPSGRFLYGSNRGHDSIAVLAVDPATGKLNPVERVPTGGKTPRNFCIDPTGTFLLAANQDSDSIVLFRIDPATGRLTPTGERVSVGMPVCIRFVVPR
jgi:6-phosphogluconolactonase